MKTKIFVMTLCAVILLSCTTVDIHHMPKKDPTEDKEVVYLVNEYKELAEIMNIKFPSQIGVHFVRMEEDQVVGMCHYGFTYRQIELDKPYWGRASLWQRTAVVYHELTHCYCGRNHDYKGKKYPEDAIGKAVEREIYNRDGRLAAYFDDGCPRSLMFPNVVPDECMSGHYGEYILEMFQDCHPY